MKLIVFHRYRVIPIVASMWITLQYNEFQKRQRLSTSPQLTSALLKVTIKAEVKIDKGAREVQEQRGDGEEVLNLSNTSAVLNTVPNTIHNEVEHECRDEAVRLLNPNPFHISTDDCVQGYEYSITVLLRGRFLAHKVSAIWFIVRRWVEILISQKDLWQMKWVLASLHLNGRVSDIQTADWECCNRVAAVHLVGDYPGRVCENGTEQPTQNDQWWMEVTSIVET